MIREKLFKIGLIISIIGIVWLIIINLYSTLYLKSLNLDYKHQDYIYELCYEKKDYNACLIEVSKDLEKLIAKHEQNNEKILENTINVKMPVKSFFSYYAMSENSILEEYIMIKMLLKKNVLRKKGDLVAVERFKVEMTNYLNNSKYYTKKQRTLKLLKKREY